MKVNLARLDLDEPRVVIDQFLISSGVASVQKVAEIVGQRMAEANRIGGERTA
jgi:hypothetical protein